MRMARVTKMEASQSRKAGDSRGGARATPQEEEELVRQAQRGDAGAYEELISRNQQRVFAVVGGILRRREDIEDIVQQVFIKAYFSLRRFDLRSAFGTWLYKIAVNECWDYLRKKRVRRLVYQADLNEDQVRGLNGVPGAAATHDPPSDAERRTEQRDLLDRLMEELEERDRLMLVLKEVEGFSVEEIGRVLDLNVNTVKVRLFRARGRLVEVYRKRFRDHPGTRARTR